jgi:hypothetical protein
MKLTKKYFGVILTFMVFCLIFTSPSQAIEIVKEEKPTQFAIGYEASYPFSQGLSITYNISKSFAVQQLITMSPEPIEFSTTKILYKFARTEERNTYFYALSGRFEDGYSDSPKMITGYSIGIGTEYTPDFYPTNFKNYAEIGYVDFQSSKYPASLMISIGLKVYY